MVHLVSNQTKLIEIGKQLQITLGAVTMFSIANNSIMALLSDDATVIDEGQTCHGTTAIRPGRPYTNTTDILGADALTADRLVVTGRLTATSAAAPPS